MMIYACGLMWAKHRLADHLSRDCGSPHRRRQQLRDQRGDQRMQIRPAVVTWMADGRWRQLRHLGPTGKLR